MPSGSLRRGQDSVGDLEILAASENPAGAIDDLSRLPAAGRVLHVSERRLYLLLERVQLGVRFPRPSDAGAALLRVTGSLEHLRRLEGLARDRNVDLYRARGNRRRGLRAARPALHPAGNSKRRR